MKKNLLALTSALAVVTATAAPAFASTMPKIDFGRSNTLGLGVGNGIGVSVDFPVTGALSLGGAVSTRAFTGNMVDVRGLYKITKLASGKLDLGVLAGVQVWGASFGQFNVFDPFVGVALAYPLTKELTLRGNVAVSIGLSGSYSGTSASGIELAYAFSPNLEGTIGGNGRGDVLGLKLSF